MSVQLLEMELVGVRVELPANTPILLLRERTGLRRMLPIYIGAPEATSIAFALDGIEVRRPITHDLFATVLGELGATLARVVINDLQVDTFFAELHLRTGDDEKVISARPSDAIALAVRLGTPVFAAPGVLEEAGYFPDDEQEESPDPEEVVEEFREFIDSVIPEDFAS